MYLIYFSYTLFYMVYLILPWLTKLNSNYVLSIYIIVLYNMFLLKQENSFKTPSPLNRLLFLNKYCTCIAQVSSQVSGLLFHFRFQAYCFISGLRLIVSSQVPGLLFAGSC